MTITGFVVEWTEPGEAQRTERKRYFTDSPSEIDNLRRAMDFQGSIAHQAAQAKRNGIDGPAGVCLSAVGIPGQAKPQEQSKPKRRWEQ